MEEIIGDKERAQNTFSSEEFGKLEKKEEKRKGLLHKILVKATQRENEKKADKNPNKESSVDISIHDISVMLRQNKKSIDQLIVTVEKLEGKFELKEDNEKAINERIADINEHVGELRSTIVERERFFDKMEIEFESMKGAVHDIKPEKLEKKFEEKDILIMKNQARIEETNSLLKNLMSELAKYRKMMSRIQSFDNLLKSLKTMDEHIKTMENIKRESQRMTAKMEQMFFEVNQKLSDIGTHDDKISSLEGITNDLVKSFDNAIIKIEDRLTKEESAKTINKLNKEIAVLKDALFDKELSIFEVKTSDKKNKDGNSKLIKEAQNLMEQEKKLILSNELHEANEIHNKILELYQNASSNDIKKRIVAQWHKVRNGTAKPAY
ncbi:MAG: hypothetical protein KAK00_09665 [Nanoarchaeota archaeon]|nr:hypothetical protein [Nanoarchaeota archaeon]